MFISSRPASGAPIIGDDLYLNATKLAAALNTTSTACDGTRDGEADVVPLLPPRLMSNRSGSSMLADLQGYLGLFSSNISRRLKTVRLRKLLSLLGTLRGRVGVGPPPIPEEHNAAQSNTTDRKNCKPLTSPLLTAFEKG